MFNAEFYPTPHHVIADMVADLEIQGNVFCEPEGGTGRIVEYLKDHGAASVLACEKDDDLRKILQTKCTVIGEDWLKVESHQISHIYAIVMNPPFSCADTHILHAFNIAPPGCKIRALCNMASIENAFSKTRKELLTLVETYGQYRDLGNCFSEADRQTDVKVAYIMLEKPGEAGNEFSGFFMEEEKEAETGPGLMPYNVIRDLVNRYVRAVQIYDQQIETAVQLSDVTSGFYGGDLGLQITRNSAPLSRNEFKKGMQKSGWLWVFSKLNMAKYATRGLKDDINKFVETQTDVPFTMRNIYKMLEIVVGTQEARMNKAIIEVFEKVTGHHADNKKGLEGWKTNSHYLLTKRFIMPTMTKVAWGGGVEGSYSSSNFEMVEDLIKALCYVTGDNYDEKIDLQTFLDYHWLLTDKDGKYIPDSYRAAIHERSEDRIKERQARIPGSVIKHNDLQWGKWIEWDFFRIRAYKKGTMHFEFNDEKTWGLFNQRVAKIKGYPLPEYKKQTAYQDAQNRRGPVEPMRVKKEPVILGTFKINNNKAA